MFIRQPVFEQIVDYKYNYFVILLGSEINLIKTYTVKKVIIKKRGVVVRACARG